MNDGSLHWAIEREIKTDREVDRLKTSLRRIASLEPKNVPKYAQQIAKEALQRS